MRFKPILSLALVSVLSAPLALAQQPSSGSPPSPSHMPPGPPSRHMGHDEHGGMSDGMRPDFRIAPPGMWWKYPDLVEKLNITADQQKRMDDIFQKSRLELVDLKASLEKQELLLQPMLSENPPDTNKVLAQIDSIAHARANLERGNARMLLGIRGVLTPDQWTKLQAEAHEYHDRMVVMRRFHSDGHGEHRDSDGNANAPGPPPKP